MMKPMLAGAFRAEKVELKLPVFGQIKYDGIRCPIVNGVSTSRSLKPVRSEQMQSWSAHNKHVLEGIDGEAICGDPMAKNCFSRTDSSIMSFNKPDEDLRFYMFDKWDEPGKFEQRLQVIEDLHSAWVRDGGSDTLRLAETTLLWNMDDIWEFHDNAISMGQEGIILRDPKSYYKFGRGSPVQCELIKMKEGGWVDTEVLITGFNEENENTNEQTRDNLGNAQRSGHKENLIGKGTLGSFDVNGYLVEDGRSFECRVGSGLDASQRAEIWANKADYLGRFIKIKYFNRGIKDKPRFPIFLGFRSTDDMEPEAVKQLDLFK